MTRLRKRQHRSPLPQVDLGKATAESDQRLPDYYYENDYFRAATDLSDRRILFVGDKGTGKSAVLEMVARKISGPKMIRLGADDIGIGLLSNAKLVEGLGTVDLGLIYKAIWDYLILISIVKAEFGTTRPSWWSFSVPKDEKDVYELLAKTGELEQGSFKLGRAFITILQKLQLKLSASSPDGTEISVEGRLADTIQRDVGTLITEIGILKHIGALRRELPTRCQHSRFFVLIDDLDDGWNNTPTQRECLKALVKSLIRLSHFTNVRFLVAMRRVIFEEVGFDDPDKVRDHIAMMTWGKDDLREIALTRLSVCLKRGRDDLLLNVFPENVQGMDSFNFMHAFLPQHPRAYIQFLQCALNSAVKDAQPFFRAEDYQVARRQYSEWFSEDLSFEYKTVFPGLKKVLLKMMGCKKEMPVQEMRRRMVEILGWALDEEKDYELEWVRQQINQSGTEAEDADDLCRRLISIGVIGVKMGMRESAEFFPANLPKQFSDRMWFKISPYLEPFLMAT